MSALFTIEQACEALPSRPKPRWLSEFVRKTKFDPQGRPLYRKAGRAKLVYLDRVIEALPCPSVSSTPVKAKARTTRSEAHISASELTRAAELTGDLSLDPSSSGSKGRSSEASTRRAKIHLVAGSARS